MAPSSPYLRRPSFRRSEGTLSSCAELRYQSSLNSKPKKAHLTLEQITENLKVNMLLSMHKSKSVKDARKQWRFFQRVMSLTQKQKHDVILTGAIAAQFLSQNSRVRQLQSGLSQVAAVLVLPFAVPPMLMIGVPTLIFLMPLFLLAWVILALNRQAKEIRERVRHSRNVQPDRKYSMRRRLGSFVMRNNSTAFAGETTESSSMSTRTASTAVSRDASPSSRSIKQASSSSNIHNSRQPNRAIKKKTRRSSFKHMFGSSATLPPNIEECSQTSDSQASAPVTEATSMRSNLSALPSTIQTNTTRPTRKVRIEIETMRVPRTAARPRQRKSWIFGTAASSSSS